MSGSGRTERTGSAATRLRCVWPAVVLAVGLWTSPGQAASQTELVARLFPEGARLVPVPVEMTKAERKSLRRKAKVRVDPRRIRAWRVVDGDRPLGWFFVDEVIGKHEFITYGAGIDAEGRVIGIDVLEYRETYGGEVQEESWRRQFDGKSLGTDQLRLGKDVHGIAGATLSARNITDGVRKLLLVREFLLERGAAAAGTPDR